MSEQQRELPGMPDERRNVSGVTPTQKKDKRNRLQFRFWLDRNKPDEAELGFELELLKERRKYAAFMRDAIRLLLSLMVGEWSVLLELFPAIVESIQSEAVSSAERIISGMEIENDALRRLLAEQRELNAALRDTIAIQQDRIESLEFQVEQQPASVSFAAMVQEMSELRKALSDRPNPPENGANTGDVLQDIATQGEHETIAMRPIQGGVTLMDVPQFDVSFDDEEMELVAVKDEQAGNRASQNFLNSLMALQSNR